MDDQWYVVVEGRTLSGGPWLFATAKVKAGVDGLTYDMKQQDANGRNVAYSYDHGRVWVILDRWWWGSPKEVDVNNKGVEVKVERPKTRYTVTGRTTTVEELLAFSEALVTHGAPLNVQLGRSPGGAAMSAQWEVEG